MFLQNGKDQYIQMLVQNGDFEAAREKAALDLYSPLFKQRLIHAEETPVIKDYNTMLVEAKNDLNIIQYEIMFGATKLKTLADSIALRFDHIEQLLAEEKSLRDDMQMLCNAYGEFESLIVVDNYITHRTCDYRKGIFKAHAVQSEKVNFEITQIEGNGMAGNEFVLNSTQDGFLKTSAAYDDERALQDSDLQTYYDYQRITVNASDTLYDAAMHKDALPARCHFYLTAENIVNECQIKGEPFILNDLYFSNDGATYTSALELPVKVDNTQTIAASGYCAFPSGKYLKLACESCQTTTDQIAIEMTEEDQVTLHKITGAKRHLIRLNEIELSRSTYDNNSYFTTDNLLNYPVQAVAVYADTYIPQHFKADDYILFTLTINGRAFEIVPINSALNGIKIIKTSTLELHNSYSDYINEPITDVRLTVRFKCPNTYESAVANHIRLLVGEKYEN